MQHLADYIGIVDHGRLIREGPLERFLQDGALVRVLVPHADVPRAMTVLTAITPDVAPPSAGGPGGGWITVRVGSDRAADVNRLLAQNDIYASGIEAFNDLEQVFLALTSPAAQPHPGAPAGPPPGWGPQGPMPQ